MSFRISLLFIFVFFAFGLLDYDRSIAQTVKEKPVKEQIETAWTKAGWKIKPKWSVVTDDDMVKRWGQQLESLVSERAFNQIGKDLVDFDAMAAFVVSGIKNNSYAAGFRRGARDGLNTTFKKLGEPDSSYRFQRVLQTKFGPGALMRFVGADMSLNYHLWRLQKNPDGKPLGLDMYMFVSGESFSEMMRRLCILSVPKDNRSYLDKLIGRELQFALHQKKLLEIIKSSRKPDPKKVLELYWQLPVEMQREKFLLLLRMVASQATGDDEYKRTLQDIQRFHPNAAFGDLVSLDLYFLNKQFDKYFNGIQRIEKTVGPDAHLMLLRHGAFTEQKKPQEGEAALRKAVQLEPDYENVPWTLLAHYVEQKKIPEAIGVLRTLAKEFEYVEFDFTGVPDYEQLQDSKQLKELNEELAKQHTSESGQESDVGDDD